MPQSSAAKMLSAPAGPQPGADAVAMTAQAAIRLTPRRTSTGYMVTMSKRPKPEAELMNIARTLLRMDVSASTM